MKLLLLITFVVISGCLAPQEQRYRNSTCPKNGQKCFPGDVVYKSLEDCEDFVTKAAKFQPEVGRICIKY